MDQVQRTRTIQTTRTTRSSVSSMSVEAEFLDYAGVVEGVSRTWTRRSDCSHRSRAIRRGDLMLNDESQATKDPEEAPQKTSCLSAMPWYLWPLLISIDTIGPFSTDAYLPNIMEIKEHFHTSTMMVTLTLQLNWIVTALASTAVGVLADRYGRRSVLMACFSVYVAATVLAATSQSISVLIAARLLMAVGQGSQVLAQVIARDLIDDPKVRLRVMAMLGSLMPFVVVSAPIVGGSIGHCLGWRWVFWIQAAWGALAFLGSMAMRETRHEQEGVEGGGEERAAKDSGSSSLRTTACQLLTSREYMGAVGVFGFMFAMLAAMLTLLPFVLQQYYGLSVAATGGIFGTVPPFVMGGSVLSMLLGKYLTPLSMLRATMLLFAGVAALTVLLATCYGQSSFVGIPVSAWWPLLVPCFLMAAINGLLTPVCQTMYLNTFKDIAGAAAGASGFVQTVMMAAGSALASAAWDGTPRSFYATIAALMLMAQLWFWLTLGLCPPPAVAEETEEEKEKEEKEEREAGVSSEGSTRRCETDSSDVEHGRVHEV